MSEIMVQRNKCPLLSGTDFEQALIRDSAHSLVRYRRYVMARCTQQLLAAVANVFVEFEPHTALSSGTDMIRSRAASAP